MVVMPISMDPTGKKNTANELSPEQMEMMVNMASTALQVCESTRAEFLWDDGLITEKENLLKTSLTNELNQLKSYAESQERSRASDNHENQPSSNEKFIGRDRFARSLVVYHLKKFPVNQVG